MTESDRETDVLVIGSGAAGLVGALAASAGGARVVVVEKSALLGGTSAMSGGNVWVPANHRMAALGASDSAEEALAYLTAVAPEGWAASEAPLWRAFVRHAPEMLRFLEANTRLRFAAGIEPDPYAEAPGGKDKGRCVSPRPLAMRIAAPFRVRHSTMMQSYTYEETANTHFFARPLRGLLRYGPRALWRKLAGQRAMGGALIAGLVRGCLERGVGILAATPASRLIVEHGRVVGAEVERARQRFAVRARRGVLLASGGFEWNPEMMARYLPGPYAPAGSPRTNTGDGQRMAQEAGARLDRMDQSLIYPTKETTYEGAAAGVPWRDLKLPHVMLVNRAGRRFVNEVQVNIGLAFEVRDPATGMPVNLPAWRIFDAQYVRKYRHVLPARRTPPDMFTAPTLEGLAGQIGVDPGALADTARRFSEHARAGRDPEFGRGSHLWDVTTLGDPLHAPNPVLGAIEQPPFHAVPFHVTYLTTKGGARTDDKGRVLRADGSRIAGLYAAGSVMANPIGSKAVGAGTTLGPCLTWGYICGLNLLRENA